ncbi:hypothetical protein Q4485_17385 [Granulosicoccaceae sp. 1_MG-2023]|nr:hypothetical protein [Granulosicoccaceae sp. 1_MG-2023]
MLLPLLPAVLAVLLPGSSLMISGTGLVSALLLLVVLTANTFASVYPHASTERFLIRRRPLFVLAAISATLLHVFMQLLIYTEDGKLNDMEVLSGWIALAGLCLTLLLSRSKVQTHLRPWMLLYPLAGFMIFHWYHGTGSPAWLLLYVLALAGLELIRLVHHVREDFFEDYRPSN